MEPIQPLEPVKPHPLNVPKQYHLHRYGGILAGVGGLVAVFFAIASFWTIAAIGLVAGIVGLVILGYSWTMQDKHTDKNRDLIIEDEDRRQGYVINQTESMNQTGPSARKLKQDEYAHVETTTQMTNKHIEKTTRSTNKTAISMERLRTSSAKDIAKYELDGRISQENMARLMAEDERKYRATEAALDRKLQKLFEKMSDQGKRDLQAASQKHDYKTLVKTLTAEQQRLEYKLKHERPSMTEKLLERSAMMEWLKMQFEFADGKGDMSDERRETLERLLLEWSKGL